MPHGRPTSRFAGCSLPFDSGPLHQSRDRRDVRDSDILASARRRNLRSPSHERSIRLMEEQLIHSPLRAEIELHPEALKLVDDEGSALVGTEFVGWLAPNCQREFSSLSCPTPT